MKEFKIGTLVSKEELLNEMVDVPVDKKRIYNGKYYENIEYLRVSVSFDIEVSKFEDFLAEISKRKRSVMYIWQFGFNGNCCVGRTWDEFKDFMNDVHDKLNLSDKRILTIYVHNLGYEFQWIRNMFNWTDVFAREKRSPMKAVTDNGFEFRCSYMLSGCSLEQTCKDLTKYKVKKMVGDLDYELVRTPLTKLSDEELLYCINDVLGVMAFIQEELEYYGSMTKIPMTKTGKVRLYCREKCFPEDNKNATNNYKRLMSTLTIDGEKEYNLLKEAFQGGFTHASCKKAGKTIENVQSWDFTSSYPTVMVSEKMPMSKGVEFFEADIDEIENDDKHLFVFTVELKGITDKIKYEHILGFSKCFNVENAKLDNGRIISADSLITVTTNVDWKYLRKFYDFEEVNVGFGYMYEAGYLPTPFVKCVLDFYKDKTTLKDIAEKVAEYSLKKGMLNSCYGMSVTDICSPVIIYDEDWDDEPCSIKDSIEKYNTDERRFLFYPWGVFITAFSRANLYRGILECDLGNGNTDYCYSDTDSIKIEHKENHMKFIEDYNKEITEKLEKACKAHGLDFEYIRPKTIKGKEKPLGVWDDDGFYKRFKTLGSKRYLVEDFDVHIKCTVAGAHKKKTSEYIAMQENPFEFFNNKMCIPEEYSGRMIVSYLDYEMDGVVYDYEGVPYEYHEMSGIHMEASEYNLTMTDLYLALIGAKEGVESI